MVSYQRCYWLCVYSNIACIKNCQTSGLDSECAICSTTFRGGEWHDASWHLYSPRYYRNLDSKQIAKITVNINNILWTLILDWYSWYLLLYRRCNTLTHNGHIQPVSRQRTSHRVAYFRKRSQNCGYNCH